MQDALDIDVWTWSLAPRAPVLARLAQHLQPDEEQRAQRFLNPDHGNHYRAGRGRLREILASSVGQPAGALRFSLGPADKPALAGLNDAPAFNLSHTGAFAALAVTRAPVTALGLDIERIRPIERDIARRFFSASEVAALEAHPPDARMAAFYRCWTRKEAFVKARGDGLGYPLDAFDVTLEADIPPALLRIASLTPAEVAHWRLIHLADHQLWPGIVGAIALETSPSAPSVRLTWHPNTDG